MSYKKFSEIPQYTSDGHYRVQLPVVIFEEEIERFLERGLVLDADFQRGHVWDEGRQVAFVEHILRGGKNNLIRANQPGWQRDYSGEFVLVDGLQRLTAVLCFVRNEIPAFGTFYRDYGDVLPWSCSLEFMVNNLKSRAEVLQWYLEINSGGVVHTAQELARVRDLLDRERLLARNAVGNDADDGDSFGFDAILKRLNDLQELECVRCGRSERMDPAGMRLCVQCSYYSDNPEQEPGYFIWGRRGSGWVAKTKWRSEDPLPLAGAVILVHRKDRSYQSKTVVSAEANGYTPSGEMRLVCVVR